MLSFEEQVHKARLYNDLWSSASRTRILLDDLVDDNLSPIVKGDKLMVSPEVLRHASQVLPGTDALRRAIQTLVGCESATTNWM